MTHRRLFSATIGALLAWTHLGFASPPQTALRTVPALDRYRAESLILNASIWSRMRLSRGGRELDLGYLGGRYNEIFASSDAALGLMKRYRATRITGGALWVGALAVLTVQLGLWIADSDLVRETNSRGERSFKPLFWGFLVPAEITFISGMIVSRSANYYLTRAVNAYNHDLIQSVSGAASRYTSPHAP